MTASVQNNEHSDLYGTFVWPSEEKLGPYEIAAIADPFFDPEPAWGACSGVNQSLVDDANLQNHVIVTLSSKASIRQFKDFCRTRSDLGGILLVYSAEDEIYSPRVEGIIGTYIEVTNTDG